jgi:hypothetical protein
MDLRSLGQRPGPEVPSIHVPAILPSTGPALNWRVCCAGEGRGGHGGSARRGQRCTGSPDGRRRRLSVAHRIGQRSGGSRSGDVQPRAWPRHGPVDHRGGRAPALAIITPPTSVVAGISRRPPRPQSTTPLRGELGLHDRSTVISVLDTARMRRLPQDTADPAEPEGPVGRSSGRPGRAGGAGSG